MIRRASCLAFVATLSLLTCVSSALAADPSKIGKNLEDIVSPNVKSLWRIGVLVALVAIVLTRPKGSFVAATFIAIVISGAIIFNPGGFSHMVNAVGDKIL